MEKVLLICKLYNYNIDELMNENIKEVEEIKQSKININKYIEDFFDYITKTIDMFSSMKFKEKVNCLFEQCCIMIFLLFVFGIVGVIGSEIVRGLFRGLGDIYYSIRTIISSLYTLFVLILGITLFLHIFKVRYLDYYEIIKDEETSEEKIEEKNIEKKKKIFIQKKKEKIVIRDPEHSQSKFLTGLLKIILIFIKFIAACCSSIFVISFATLFCLFVISFMFVKSGILFLGSILTIIAAIIINFIILELFYNFIISKKVKKNKIAISFVIALVLAGMGIGFIFIGITNLNYVENTDETNIIKDEYIYEMSDNLSIEFFNGNVKYEETDSDEIRIEVKHSKFLKPIIDVNENNTISLYFGGYYAELEAIKIIINDINNKEIKNYDAPEIIIYTSKSNFDKLQSNQKQKYENSKDTQILELIEERETLQSDIEEIEIELQEKEDIINDLESELIEIKSYQEVE